MNEKDLASSEWVNLITVVVSQSHHHWPTNFYTFVSEPTSAVVAVVVVADVADAVALRHDAHYFAVVGIEVDIEVAVGIDTDAVAEEQVHIEIAEPVLVRIAVAAAAAAAFASALAGAVYMVWDYDLAVNANPPYLK